MGGREKALLAVRGRPLLAWTLDPFLAHPGIDSVVVALPSEAAADPPSWLLEPGARLQVVPGGATRAESVAAALEALPEAIDVVLVHDAARPLVTRTLIDRCLAAVGPGIGAVAGWPAVDTLKAVDDEEWVVQTPDRLRLRHAQTPQGFRRDELAAAYRAALVRGEAPTDDASAFEAAGGRVRIVSGARWNLKVTVPEDLPVVEALLGARTHGEGGAK